jgi:thiol-disulfide isomerase/thioredoxin
LLRLKEIDDPLMVGKYFFKPTGKTPDLKDCKFNASSSKYTLIEFWASWCKPCRENNPGWNSILDKYQNKGFQILGISLDDNLYRWKKAIEEDKLGKWTHVSDLAGGFNGYNGLKYKIEVIPFNVLIDSTGKIIYRDVKPSVLSKLLDSIDNHLQ